MVIDQKSLKVSYALFLVIPILLKYFKMLLKEKIHGSFRKKSPHTQRKLRENVATSTSTTVFSSVQSCQTMVVI